MKPTTVEQHRAFWADVGKKNGWYSDGMPLPLVMWVDEDGVIKDSVYADAHFTEDITVPWHDCDDECETCCQS